MEQEKAFFDGPAAEEYLWYDSGRNHPEVETPADVSSPSEVEIPENIELGEN